MSVKNLLESLVKVSEKGANIARICRQNEHLFGLLVQEKSVEESNPRFVQDFKTLADVLIQETVKNDIGKLFPEMRENIKGEESPNFTNALGETIIVEIFENAEDTANRLEKVLDGDRLAATMLSDEVHREIVIDKIQIPASVDELTVDVNDLGIWIDPIDATAEYIKGEEKLTVFPNIPSSGLKCVTVLIGVYQMSTGVPIIGVINQPFAANDDSKEHIYWGLTIGDSKLSNVPALDESAKRPDKIAILSSADKKFISYLRHFNYRIVNSAGAGHKILKVITGEVDLYLNSKGTTYKWDSCGPQAILNAVGGGLINLRSTIFSNKRIDIDYNASNGNCNIDGVLGFREFDKLDEIVQSIKNIK